MENNRFVVLTGHLSKHPLPDLVGILRQQRKTGRLLIEYPKGPATLFFENGDLIDVRLNELKGLQAVCVLLAQPEASFNFNPLIRSSERSIEPALERVVSELFGHWEEPVQIEGSASTPSPKSIREIDAPPIISIEGRRAEPLALPPANIRRLRQTSRFVIAVAVLIIIGISTVIALTGSLSRVESQWAAADQRNQLSAQPDIVTANPTRIADGANATMRNRRIPSAESRRTANRPAVSGETETSAAASGSTNTKEATKLATAGASSSEPIKVVMHIENGRVLKAAIANHTSGMDSFEALALRIARQRRYPTAKTGPETVTITVNKLEK
jgi:hypothetical protein